MLEVEEKFKIDCDTFNALVSEFSDAKVIVQTNHYYLQQNPQFKATVRIREIDGKLLLQVKLNKSEQGSLHIKEEFEKELDSIPKQIDSKTLSELTGKEFNDCVYLGFLTTERHSYMFNPTTEICIDKNTYLGITDYELEVEYTDEFPEALTDKLLSFGIKKGVKVRGKFSRFLSKLGEK